MTEPRLMGTNPSTCLHARGFVDLGPDYMHSGRVLCRDCGAVLDYYGNPGGPIGTVHRFPDASMALAIVEFLRPHLDAISEDLPELLASPATRDTLDLYRELVNRLNSYFAYRPENPFKPRLAPAEVCDQCRRPDGNHKLTCSKAGWANSGQVPDLGT